MPKLTTLLLVANLLSIQAFSQITYGKEDCGPVFDKWIKMLNEVKEACTDEFSPAVRAKLSLWVNTVHAEILQSHLRILQENEGEGPVLISLINTLHNAVPEGSTNYSPLKVDDGKAMSSEEFFSNYNSLPSDKNVFNALALISSIQSIESAIEVSNSLNSDPKEAFFKFSKPGERDVHYALVLNSFYVYLMNIVEHDQAGKMDGQFERLYRKAGLFLERVTNVTPPPFEHTDDVKNYIKQFSWQILYAFRRYKALPSTNENSIAFSPTPEPGKFGENRFNQTYFNKMFASYFRSQLTVLMQHITNLKKSCASTDTKKLGELTVSPFYFDIEQVDNKYIPQPKTEPDGGRVWLKIRYRNSAGKELANTNIAQLFRMDRDGPVYYGGRYLNAYTEVDPGKYLVKYRHFVEDSILIEALDMINKPDFPVKGSLQVIGMDANGNYVEAMNVRVEKIKPRSENSLEKDTIFLGLFNNSDQPCDLTPGVYRAGIRMPPNFYPQVFFSEAVIKAETKTFLTLSGYGQLLVKTMDATGNPKQVQVNIFSTVKNPATNDYVFLRRINGMDTLNMKPGAYRVQVEYAFPIIKNVEIKSDLLTEELFDNIGSLNVRKSGTNQWIDIQDNNTGAKTAFRNNTTIELQADHTYTVTMKVDGERNPRQFSNVKILPKQTTTINW